MQRYTKTISKYTTLMNFIHTNLTSQRTSRGASQNWREFCTGKGTSTKNFSMKLLKLPCLKLFFTKSINMFSGPHGLLLYRNLGVDFFSNSELLCPNMKNRLRTIRARSDFCMISDNPNVSLRNVCCSLYTRHFVLRDDYHKKMKQMLAYTPVEYYFWTLTKTVIIPARQNQFIQENICNKAPVLRIVIARSTNSAITGSFTKNSFWYQQLHLRQIGILKKGQKT